MYTPVYRFKQSKMMTQDKTSMAACSYNFQKDSLPSFDLIYCAKGTSQLLWCMIYIFCIYCTIYKIQDSRCTRRSISDSVKRSGRCSYKYDSKNIFQIILSLALKWNFQWNNKSTIKTKFGLLILKWIFDKIRLG